MYEIKITRSYTLPRSRENRGRTGIEPHTYENDPHATPTEWAVGVLEAAGCLRYNGHSEFITEEPKITDFERGEEMTAYARLTGFTPQQIAEIVINL